MDHAAVILLVIGHEPACSRVASGGKREGENRDATLFLGMLRLNMSGGEPNASD